MRGLVAVAALLLAGNTSAETTLREIAWPASLPDDARHNTDGSVTVTSSSDDGVTVTLVEVESPGITRYAVKGRVRYENVSGEGYIEMWNVFAEGRYFTRTIGDQGPMRTITGNSDWRSVALPFEAAGAEAPPERLIINVVLPGRGEVTLGPLTLVELEPGEWPSGVNDSALPGLWGGIVGATFGIAAGLLGWLGSMGKAKRFVLAGFRMMMAAGGVSLVLGVIALAQGLPYHVYYPLLLIGAIALLVPASTLARLTKRYEELELRRMSALDA
ncbi:MAG: hypothetical protein BMS9Abin37_2770 [Acidobacteriota bacterium]|nr:MAG: hypothetical protein BMS9Abin37_2770 [Acidobacteriota bacterium]